MPGHKTARAATMNTRARSTAGSLAAPTSLAAPSARDFAAPEARDIRLDLISMTEWRVCDRRFSPSDSRAVLGFIERHGFDYEVTDLKAPDKVQVFTGLASATASFTVND